MEQAKSRRQPGFFDHREHPEEHPDQPRSTSNKTRRERVTRPRVGLGGEIVRSAQGCLQLLQVRYGQVPLLRRFGGTREHEVCGMEDVAEATRAGFELGLERVVTHRSAEHEGVGPGLGR